MKGKSRCHRVRFVSWTLVGVFASPGSIILAASQTFPETTASVALRSDGEDPAPQVESELETIDRLLIEGRYPEAETAAREALTELEASGQGETLEAAWYADRLVEALLQSDKATRPEALTRSELAVAIKEATLGPNHVGTARSLHRLGRVRTRRADFPAAEETLGRALRILEQGGDASPIDTAGLEQSMGHLLHAEGRYEEASAHFETALGEQEEILGPDSPVVATTLRMIGDSLRERRDEAAGEYLLRAVRILEVEVAVPHPDLAAALSARGHYLTQEGDFVEAREMLERALAMYEATLGPDHPSLATALTRLGQVLIELGDYPGANSALERSEKLHLLEHGAEDLETLDSSYQHCRLKLQMGDSVGAAERFAEMIPVRERLLGSYHPVLASDLQGRALALIFSTDASDGPVIEEAEALLLRALDIRTQSLGPDNLAVAETLTNMGNILYDQTRDYEKALEFSRRSLAILESVLDPYDYRIDLTLYGLTMASRGIGDMTSAIDYGRRMLETSQRARGPLHPYTAAAWSILAALLAETGAYAEALEAAIQGETLYRDHLEFIARTGTEEEALGFAFTRGGTIALQIAIAVQSREAGGPAVRTAWDSVIRNRGLVLQELMARRRIAAHVDTPELEAFVGNLRVADQELANLVVAGSAAGDPGEFLVRLETARSLSRRAERELASRSAEYRRMLAPRSIGLQEVIDALPPGSSLVAFFRYTHELTTGDEKRLPMGWGEPSVAAFVVSATDRVPRVVRIMDAPAIAGLADGWRGAILREARSIRRATQASEKSYRQIGTELREAIWDPLSPLLGDSRDVFVVLDDQLLAVDLATLPVGDSSYLVESGPTIHYLSSERDLILESPVPRGGQLLALGAPDFDSPELFAALRRGDIQLAKADGVSRDVVYRGPRSACASFQSMSFEPLPASAQEVEQILDLWGQDISNQNPAIALTGAAASETAFKELANGKRVLHLATHGFFLGGDCGSALAPDEDDLTTESPLLLSGLVMAGANHRDAAGADEDDGILTGEEIATLDLEGTEWAVLSACDTGSGVFHYGEGLLGLQRAFRMAGAQTLIISLWPVEDDTARAWMTGLYRRHFVEGMSTMDSVRGANLELLQERRAQGLSTHPYYWAGFIASGDWR